VRIATPKNLRRPNLIRFAAVTVFVLIAFAPECSAQEKTTLRRVEIVGLQKLSPDQVIATSGLKVGDLIDARTIDAAADKLMRSGWFTSVNYRVNTADIDSTVVFEVAEKAAPPTASPGDALGEVVWGGNVALSNQELASAFALRAGDSVSRTKTDQALDAVRKAYAQKGYINAQITEATTRDAANRRVNYQFAVREGQQYRMGALTVTGVSPADVRQLKSKWTLAPNAVFDDSYLDQFRSNVIRPFVSSLAQRTGLRSKFEVSTKPNMQKQTVDVIITFK
jgi:outer membrane protein assembly factor BamA